MKLHVFSDGKEKADRSAFSAFTQKDLNIDQPAAFSFTTVIPASLKQFGTLPFSSL